MQKKQLPQHVKLEIVSQAVNRRGEDWGKELITGWSQERDVAVIDQRTNELIALMYRSRRMLGWDVCTSKDDRLRHFNNYPEALAWVSTYTQQDAE